MAYIWELPGWNSGAKVRRSSWERGDYIYRRDDGTWADYTLISSDDIAHAAMNSNDWELYTEPPVEVEVFEWLYEDSIGYWVIIDQLMTEAEAAEYFNSGEEYRKTGRSFKVPVTGKGSK